MYANTDRKHVQIAAFEGGKNAKQLEPWRMHNSIIDHGIFFHVLDPAFNERKTH